MKTFTLDNDILREDWRIKETGVEEIEEVQKFNHNHYPSGSPKGGQFAPSSGGFSFGTSHGGKATGSFIDAINEKNKPKPSVSKGASVARFDEIEEA